MIYGLDLEGFQSFGLKQEIEFAPLTLIFGPNSVGKSSIGRVFRLLSQSQNTGGGLRYSGDLLNLGAFVDASHKRKVTKDAFIRIGLRMAFGDAVRRDDFRLSACFVEMVFSPQDPHKPAWIKLAGVLELDAAEEGETQASFTLTLSRLSDPAWSPDAHEATERIPLGPLSDDAKITRFFVSNLGSVFTKLVGLNVPDDCDLLGLDDEFQLRSETGIERRKRRFQEVFNDFFFSFRSSSGFRGLNLLPRLRMPDRSATSLLHTFVDRLLRRCAAGLDDSVRQFQYIGPLRNVSSEYVSVSGQWTKLRPDAGNLQEHLTSLSDGELTVVSRAISSLTDGQYSLLRSELPPHLVGVGGYQQVVLYDHFLKAEVTLSNAGSGISQVLPIIAGIMSMTSNRADSGRPRRRLSDPDARSMLGGLLFVEQPELHLHPAMQVRLADYLLDNSSDGLHTNIDRARGKPIVVCETHSEEILLRVLARIRAGDVARERIAIYFVDRFPDWDSSHAMRMEIDQSGNFENPWPVSFSDIRNQERLGQ